MQNCSCYQNLSYDISCYYSRTRSRSVSIKSSIKVYFDERPRWRYPFHDLTTSDQIAHRAQPNNLRWNGELLLKTQVSHSKQSRSDLVKTHVKLKNDYTSIGTRHSPKTWSRVSTAPAHLGHTVLATSLF